MRDPDLVQRAEQAAAALEKAWIHWRMRHGLATGQLPPVTSYVGYSLTEPWGQPRVVFGVDAEEAERIAAILEGHDCVGPVHAEVASRPERWQDADAGRAPVGYADAEAQTQSWLAHPASVQPAPDAAKLGADAGGPGEMLQPAVAQQSAPAQFAPAGQAQPWVAQQATFPAAMRPADAQANLPTRLPADAASRDELAGGPAAEAPLPSAFPALPVLPTPSGAASDTALTTTAEGMLAAEIQETAAATGHHGAPASAGFPAAAALSAADGMPPAAPQDVPAPQAGIVPLRPRPIPQPEHLEVSHEPLRLTGSPGAQASRPDTVEDRRPELAASNGPDLDGEGQIARARLMPVSKPNRTRRPAAETPEAGQAQQGVAKQKPTDTAV